jgi:hypothetical protein
MTAVNPEVEAKVPEKLSREIRARIRRRALALSHTSYTRYEQLLQDQVRAGAVVHVDIETWTPPELATTK